MNKLVERTLIAVNEGVSVRSEYYSLIELEDEQKLGPPAKPELIRKFEEQLNCRLPPSYRSFLELHDGWKMVDGDTDLLPIADILNGPIAQKIKAWKEQMKKMGENIPTEGLIIGFSEISQSRIILTLSEVSEDGESKLVQWSKDFEDYYDNFIIWLEQSNIEYRELIKEEVSAQERFK